MGVNYLFDSNILIYLLNSDIPPESLDKVKNILDSSFNISAISKVEVLGWNKLKGNELLIAENFIKNANILEISLEIINKAIFLRQSVSIKTPDAIIAATAMINNLSLITRNSSDFAKINTLEIYNPFELSQ